MGLPQRRLGNLSVSLLTLGTAALGQRYAGRRPPDRRAALWLLDEACAAGVTLIDTAPGYGTEAVIGEALVAWPEVRVATKVSPEHDILGSVEQSRRFLRRWRIDLVQAYWWMPRYAPDQLSHTLDALFTARARGWVRLVGVTVYTPQEAMIVLRHQPQVDVLQVPYNLLDQRFDPVLEGAKRLGVSVLARSPWLRGALAGHPPNAQVAAAVRRVRRVLMVREERLSATALRFALDAAVASVIIGPRTAQELSAAIEALECGPLSILRSLLASLVASDDDAIIDPRRWDIATDMTEEFA